MNAKAKTNSVITSELVGNILRFTVRDAGMLELDLTRLSAEVRARAVVHGLTQRVSDAAALSRNPNNGQAATPADKFAAMKARVDHYNSGASEWSLRAAGGGAGVESGLTLQAVANVQFNGDLMAAGLALDKMAETRGVKRPALLATLRSAGKVAAEIARIRAAQPSAADAEGLLGELGA